MESINFPLALAGCFTDCVTCYRHIRLGRNFEGDFEHCWAKLEASEMRLTRWGAAMGINGPDSKLNSDRFDETEVKQAYEWLRELEQAFEQAMKTSTGYGKKGNEALDTDAQIEQGSDTFRALHSHIRNVVGQRINPRKRDYVAWALHRRGAFQDLIEDIESITNNLVALFPPSHASQMRQLCQQEVQDLDAPSLKLLNGVSGKDDTALKEAIRQELEQLPNTYRKIEVKDNARGHYGDNVAHGERCRRNVFTEIKAGGKSVSHFGNNIGYKDTTTFGNRDE